MRAKLGMFDMATALSSNTKFNQDQRGISVQTNIPTWPTSRMFYVKNHAQYTLRGLHYQDPFKSKLVTCVEGVVFDVLVDLRPDSKTYLQWSEIVLSTGDSLLVQAGFAHGYLTLTSRTALVYILEGLTSDDKGVHWNDPKIAINWPHEPTVISERDRAWSNL